MTIKIKLFDFKNAPDTEYAAFNACRNQIRREQLPDDPPIPLEETILGLKNLPDFVKVFPWFAWVAGEVVAYAIIQYTMEDNLHMAQFSISVLPAYRRQGLAKQLLAYIVEHAQAENRRLLIADSNSRIPAGEHFLNRLGAQKSLEAHTNQLRLADLDQTLLRDWQEKSKARAAGFEIGLWTGPYPDEDLNAIVALHDLLNQQPLGDLDIEDFTFSPEHLRQTEQSLFARGYERWTMFVREKATGAFAGYTEVLWNPNRPEIISQGMTGIFPAFRNNGLGRWLKAAMLTKVIQARPEARFVRTENADSNAPMMKINNELGFKPYFAEAVWQIETDQAAAYLDN